MEISAETANRFILEKSHLTENAKTDNIVQIMEDLLGLHATNNTTPYISLFCRGRSFTVQQLHEIFYESKNIAKIRCIRGTVFFQYQSQIPSFHMATLDSREKQNQKRLVHFKITKEILIEYQEKILTLLKNNPLTTKEIRAKLHPVVDLSSILYILSDRGLIVRSKPRKNWLDRMNTYELFKEAVPNIKIDSISTNDAIQDLIFKYVAKYGPVCEQDIVWWTGFNKTTVRNAMKHIEDRVTTIYITPYNLDFYVLKSELDLLKDLQPLHESVISILPCLDPYIMGYKFRDRYIEELGKDYIFDRSGNATNVITLNGKTTGIWDWEVKEPSVKYFIFGGLTTNQRELVHSEMEKTGKFLFDSPFDILEKKSMESLTNRTAGWVLKPLRD